MLDEGVKLVAPIVAEREAGREAARELQGDPEPAIANSRAAPKMRSERGVVDPL